MENELLNNEMLNEELSNLKFIRKKQSSNYNEKFTTTINNENFFLNPSFEIILNDLTIKDLNVKNITFKCNLQDSQKLKYISNKLIENFKSSCLYSYESSDVKVYDIGDEYIRCCLPTVWKPTHKYNNKYTIYQYECDFFLNNEKKNFNSNSIINIKDYTINKIIFEVKNIWKTNERYAFNNVIKSIFMSEKKCDN